jgi:hypothetical protein
LVAFTLLTLCALVLSATAGLTLWAAAVCATLTGGVLVAGRRAVIAEQRMTAARADEPRPAQAGSRAGSGSASSAETDSAGPDTVGPSAAQTLADLDESPITARAKEGARGGRRPAVATKRTGDAFRLPEPLEITEVVTKDLEDQPRAGRPARRFTTPRPKTVAAPAEAPVAGGAEDVGSDTTSQDRSPSTTKGGPWTPAGVPAPSYTTMPNAPRWEPRPLTAADYAQARRAAEQATRRAAEEARAEGLETAATGQIKIPGRVIFSEDALDLDRAIAARRRAAGSN